MAKGGVVMDVTNAEQARIAEKAGVKKYIEIVELFLHAITLLILVSYILK